MCKILKYQIINYQEMIVKSMFDMEVLKKRIHLSMLIKRLIIFKIKLKNFKKRKGSLTSIILLLRKIGIIITQFQIMIKFSLKIFIKRLKENN